MATYVGMGPQNISGEQGRSFGYASAQAIHTRVNAAANNLLDLASAYADGEISVIAKLSTTASKISLSVKVDAGTTTITTSPKVIVYGIIPQTQASREQLELGVYPSSIGGGYLYEVKRLDAKIGDPGTEIPCVVADMFSDYLFKTSAVPDALYQLDTQGCEFVVVLIDTAIAGDFNDAYITATVV